MLQLRWPLAAKKLKPRPRRQPPLLPLLPHQPPWPTLLLLPLPWLPTLLQALLLPRLALLLPQPQRLMLPRMPPLPQLALPKTLRVLPKMPQPRLQTLSRSEERARPSGRANGFWSHQKKPPSGGFFVAAMIGGVAADHGAEDYLNSLTSKAAMRCPFSPTSVPPLEDSTVTLVLLALAFSATR